MILDVSVHVRAGDKVEMGKTSDESVWLSLDNSEPGKVFNTVLFFRDTNAARVFLATALHELRKLEREDFPIDPYHDHIAVPHVVVMNGKEVTVTA
jgi:hypothetical protein